MIFKTKIILFLVFIYLLGVTYSCSTVKPGEVTYSVEEAEKARAKAKKKQQKEAIKAQKEAEKAYWMMQSDAVRKKVKKAIKARRKASRKKRRKARKWF